MKRGTVKTTAATLAVAWGMTGTSDAATIAREDFDGGAINLVTSTVPTLDGGAGDAFAVGHTAAWPTTGGTPFSLTDNSVGAVGDTAAFPADTEGVYGVNSDPQNDFLAISDTREWISETRATWTFDISSGGPLPLVLRIGMGSMEGSDFTYGPTNLTFTYQVDNGTTIGAFHVIGSNPGAPFDFRPLDNGLVVSDTSPLRVIGTFPVTKLEADTGLPTSNTFLNKTPAAGPGAGQLDTFSTPIDSTGNTLVLTMTAHLPFEAVALDNIEIVSVPEPVGIGTMTLSLGGLTLLVRRRSPRRRGNARSLAR